MELGLCAHIAKKYIMKTQLQCLSPETMTRLLKIHRLWWAVSSRNYFLSFWSSVNFGVNCPFNAALISSLVCIFTSISSAVSTGKLSYRISSAVFPECKLFICHLQTKWPSFSTDPLKSVFSAAQKNCMHCFPTDVVTTTADIISTPRRYESLILPHALKWSLVQNDARLNAPFHS